VLDIEEDAAGRPLQGVVTKLTEVRVTPVREARGDGEGRLQEPPQVWGKLGAEGVLDGH
jgi:hypothetical protein